jgi:hypothetical protein
VDKAVAELQKRNLNGTIISDFKKCAEKCEFVRFAPKAGESSAKNEMYTETTKVIIDIEKNLGNVKSK